MKFKSKKKHSKKRFLILSITMFFIGIYLSFKYLNKKVEVKLNNNYTNYILDSEFSNEVIFKKLSSLIKDLKEETSISKKEEVEAPLIYIYNTHQTEEYNPNELFSFAPNVTMINYILKNNFSLKNYHTLIEERSIKEVLNNNSWNYASSYRASRTYIEDVKKKYPSIKYFIDVHRDSLPHEKTTITIGDKSYAKMLFLIGLENENYKQNLEFTNKINDKINEKYPNLSKGIYEKGGVGVNGIYNQDISPYLILAEFGGYENTTYEVLNTALAFAECYMEVIDEIES